MKSVRIQVYQFLNPNPLQGRLGQIFFFIYLIHEEYLPFKPISKFQLF